jgi:hypothetical protein
MSQLYITISDARSLPTPTGAAVPPAVYPVAKLIGGTELTVQQQFRGRLPAVQFSARLVETSRGRQHRRHPNVDELGLVGVCELTQKDAKVGAALCIRDRSRSNQIRDRSCDVACFGARTDSKQWSAYAEPGRTVPLSRTDSRTTTFLGEGSNPLLRGSRPTVAGLTPEAAGADQARSPAGCAPDS